MLVRTFLLLSGVYLIFGYPTIRKERSLGNVELAKQLDSPWLALLVIKGLRCGGSLINRKFIVTAAHCFDDREDDDDRLAADIIIYLGEWKTDRDPDCNQNDDDESCDAVAQIPPKRLYIHENYNKNDPKKNKYDIALIELRRPPRESPIIKSIVLPDPDECHGDFSDVPMTVTGFGEISPKHYTNTKKKIDLKILDVRSCKRKLANPFNELNHFCGEGPLGYTTCKGDSGSGVTNIVNNVPTLQGIVSFGSTDCGDRPLPSAFLKASCFISWIEQKMRGGKKIRVPTTGTTKTTTRTTPTIIPTKATEITTSTLVENNDNDWGFFS